MIYKYLDSSNINITPFKAYKYWTYANVTASNDIDVYNTHYNQELLPISDTAYMAGYPEVIKTKNDEYEFVMHNSLDKLFYGNYISDPHMKYGIIFDGQYRELHLKSLLFSIPQKIYGEGIHQNSISIIDNVTSTTYIDDGKGNIVDEYYYNNASYMASLSLFDDKLLCRYIFNEYSKLNLLNNETVYDYSNNGFHGQYYNVTLIETDGYSSGSINSGSKSVLQFNQTNSLVSIPHDERFNFTYNDDFIIHTTIKCNIDMGDRVYENIISKGQWWRNSPFQLQYIDSGSNFGKVLFHRYDGSQDAAMYSTSTINDNLWHDIIICKQGASASLYIDYVLEASIADLNSDNLRNDAPINIGCSYYSNGTDRFSGQIGQVYIYNTSFSNINEYQTYITARDIMYAGNAFYEQGIVTITNPRYDIDTMSTSDITFNFESTKTIYEMEVICPVVEGEYQGTYNSTLFYPSQSQMVINQSIITSSNFSPYVTTIGLYNDKYELLAVAKVARPVHIPTQNDINFVVKMDI